MEFEFNTNLTIEKTSDGRYKVIDSKGNAITLSVDEFKLMGDSFKQYLVGEQRQLING